MKLEKMLLTVGIIIIFGFAGCTIQDPPKGPNEIDEITVGDGFDYSLTRDVSVSITVFDSQSEPVPGIIFDIYTGKPAEGGNLLISGVTGDDGMLETVATVPTAIDSLVAVGFMSTVEIKISSGTASYVFGVKSEKITEEDSIAAPEASFKTQAVTSKYEYLLSYNNQGVPQGMLKDTIDADFIGRVSETLPETKKLNITHPEYLSDANQLNIKIDELADVWVTFVHEGAGYTNALGFFTFPVGKPPASADQITSIKIIFPNTSLQGSGGGLYAGDKVYLGQFPAGTMIGWVLIANGWNGKAVNDGYGSLYSLKELNPEASTSLKQHTILVWDDQTQRLLFSFEDMNRSSSGCDQDFNDVVFYATANPVTAIDMTMVQTIDEPVDTDNDGVSDNIDAYPNDPARAFNNYSATGSNYGTLAFEDYWPRKGDYDFNDLVLNYRYNQVTNAKGNIVEIQGSIIVQAIGANFANGFGIEFPFGADQVAKLTGSHEPVLETEGSDNAVVRLFDNVFDIMRPEKVGEYINTLADQPYYTPQEITFTIEPSAPLDKKSFKYQPPYNPFIFQNGDRGHEIHLPDYPPTVLADQKLFGSDDDDSAPDKGRYYKTSGNLPWALNIPAQWDYPSERNQISMAFYSFRNWAESSGVSYTDWYMDKNGYRDYSIIYKHP
jgi:LruC domain-containing protein